MTPEGRAVDAFRRAFGADPELVSRAPGRVNLIGEHVDYNGGLVLPVPIDRGIAVAAGRSAGRAVRTVAADYGEEDAFPLDGPREPGRGWRPYVRGVAALLRESGIDLSGAELAVAGDVPAGAGLSSSAALEVACAGALLGLAGRTLPGPELAALCRRAEAEWAGVRCGIMDPFVAVVGRAGHALFLDCRTLEHRQVPIPADVRLVVADSGVRRDLRDSAYNRRLAECREAAARLGVAELRDVPPADLERRGAELPEPLRRRARHVVLEIERTAAAAAALEAGEPGRVGELMYASHASLRDDFEVSIPELDVLVEAARAVPGVLGSRLIGAGFGGCTLSLVRESAVESFLERVPAAFRAATGRAAAVFDCRPAAGASVRRLGGG